MKPLQLQRGGVLLAFVLLGLASCNDDAPVQPPSLPQVPAPIRDLLASSPASGPTRSSIQLRWTVPEDPDTHGPPLSYELRYDTQTRSGDAWLVSTGQLHLTTVGHPGQTDSVVVGGLQPGRLYFFVIRSTDLDSNCSEWSNVESLATRNVPPVASFVFVGSELCPQSHIVVDASASADSEDAPGDLLRRWDWNGDGQWDSPWSAETTASHDYQTPGLYVVRLQVRDRGGATAECARVLAGITLTAVQRMWLEEVLFCCYETHGTCLEWCRCGAPHDFEGPGAWGSSDFWSFVSPDSIVFTSHSVPGQYGYQFARGNIDLRVCGAVQARILIVGPAFLQITGPNGVVFAHEIADTTLASTALDTILASADYHVWTDVRKPASVHVLLTALGVTLDEEAVGNARYELGGSGTAASTAGSDSQLAAMRRGSKQPTPIAGLPSSRVTVSGGKAALGSSCGARTLRGLATPAKRRSGPAGAAQHGKPSPAEKIQARFFISCTMSEASVTSVSGRSGHRSMRSPPPFEEDMLNATPQMMGPTCRSWNRWSGRISLVSTSSWQG